MTPQQERCLSAIELLSKGGVSPSFDELRLHLGLASKSGVHRLVHELARRGYISISPDRKRSIALVSREAETVPFDRMASAVFYHLHARLTLDMPVSVATIRGAMVEAFKVESMTGAAHG